MKSDKLIIPISVFGFLLFAGNKGTMLSTFTDLTAYPLFIGSVLFCLISMFSDDEKPLTLKISLGMSILAFAIYLSFWIIRKAMF